MDESALEHSPFTHQKPTTFFTLSREIRDTIYEYTVVSPSPLIAWAGMPLQEFQEWQSRRFFRATPGYFKLHDYLSNALPVEQAAPKLFLSNLIVAQEAAMVFYGKNIFRFVGEWSWDEVVMWLEGIGPRNRSSLARLELSLGLPQHVWQLGDGARTQLDSTQDIRGDNARERTYPRNRFLNLIKNPNVELEGVVENINPAVETCCQLLGQIKGGAKLTLSLMLGWGYTPGVQITVDAQHPCGNWMSMDLPNVMEKCRELHTANRHRSMEIIWNCAANGTVLDRQSDDNMIYSGTKVIFLDSEGSAFDRGRSALQDRGWEILEVYEKYFLDSKCDISEPMSINWFSMKRKPIEGDVVADNPSPHSWEGY